jgi:hypothetical protein
LRRFEDCIFGKRNVGVYVQVISSRTCGFGFIIRWHLKFAACVSAYFSCSCFAVRLIPFDFMFFGQRFPPRLHLGIATASVRHALQIGGTESTLALAAIRLRVRERDSLMACAALDFMLHRCTGRRYKLLVVGGREEAVEVVFANLAASLLTRLLKSQSPFTL